MKKMMNNIEPIILVLLVLIVIIVYFTKSSNKNGFDNYNLASPGYYPENVVTPLLKGEYPLTGNKNVSSNEYSDIWWHYPAFRVGSYKQITNNLRYYRNPDEGTCIGAEFCGALYHDKKTPTNISIPLDPVPNGEGPRINYYRTNVDLLL